MGESVTVCRAISLLAGLALLAQTGMSLAAPPEPGTVLLNRSRATTSAAGGFLLINQRIGPFAVPTQIFVTAYGSARAKGAKGALSTTISFGEIVHSANADDYELSGAGTTLMHATANFDFILSARQTATVKARTFLRPAEAVTPKLQLFYKAVAVECLPAVC